MLHSNQVVPLYFAPPFPGLGEAPVLAYLLEQYLVFEHNACLLYGAAVSLTSILLFSRRGNFEICFLQLFERSAHKLCSLRCGEPFTKHPLNWLVLFPDRSIWPVPPESTLDILLRKPGFFPRATHSETSTFHCTEASLVKGKVISSK